MLNNSPHWNRRLPAVLHFDANQSQDERKPVSHSSQGLLTAVYIYFDPNYVTEISFHQQTVEFGPTHIFTQIYAPAKRLLVSFKRLAN